MLVVKTKQTFKPYKTFSQIQQNSVCESDVYKNLIVVYAVGVLLLEGVSAGDFCLQDPTSDTKKVLGYDFTILLTLYF